MSHRNSRDQQTLEDVSRAANVLVTLIVRAVLSFGWLLVRLVQFMFRDQG